MGLSMRKLIGHFDFVTYLRALTVDALTLTVQELIALIHPDRAGMN
jgi:hypothetical protein